MLIQAQDKEEVRIPFGINGAMDELERVAVSLR